MKVPATFATKQKDGTLKWDRTDEDQELNFGRCMRVTIYHGKTQAIMEFCPMEDSQKCPRMEATINDIAQPNQNTGQPGFTAEIKLFNPDSAVTTLLADHQQFLLDYTKSNYAEVRFTKINDGQIKELQQYYDDRARARVECGYWVSANGESDKDGKGVNGHADYHVLFEGYINSSLEYLQGNDIILQLYCHDFDAGSISNKAVLDSIGISYTSADMEKWQNLSKKDREKRSGEGEPSWHTLAGKLCRNFLPNRRVQYPQITGEPLYATRMVTEEERERNDWYAIRYIHTPQRKDEVNIELETRMTSRVIDVSNFMTNASDFNGIFNQLCNYGKANVGYLVDLDYDQNKVIVWVFPVGSGYKPSGDKRGQIGDRGEIEIINYQNLLAPPAVSSSGQLTIKMFLNWDAEPLKSIKLTLDDNYGNDSLTGDEFYVPKVGRGLREVVMAGGKISPYMATIQGARSAAVYALEHGTKFAQEHGYLFNIGFPIIKTKHDVSTHGKEWQTTVITVPKYTGLEV